MTKKSKQNSCNIAVFFETHWDPTPTRVIINLLPTLKSLGFTIFLCEEPADRSMSGTKARLREIAIDSYKDLRYCDKHPTLKQCGSLYLDLLQAQKETMIAGLELFGLIEQHHIHYKNVDLPTSDRAKCDRLPSHKCLAKRDNYFIKQIKSACEQHSGVIFLVGNGHSDVVLKLFKEGYNVMGFAPVVDLESQKRAMKGENPFGVSKEILEEFRDNREGNSDHLSICLKNPKHFKVSDCNEDNPPVCSPNPLTFLKELTGEQSEERDEF